MTDNHRTVDDRPYGGGPGMVMLADPLEACIDAAMARQREAGVAAPKVVLMSPQGERLDGARWCRSCTRNAGLVLIAGRYEGIDERLIARRVDREVSIGDFVTSGGELPAMVVIDCIVRRLPGSLNDAESAAQDSFSRGAPRLAALHAAGGVEGQRGCPTCCCRATTRRSRAGAASRRWGARGNAGRTCCDEAGALEARTRQLLEEYRREQQAQQQQQ